MRKAVAVFLFAFLVLGKTDGSLAQGASSAKDLEQAVEEYDTGLRDLRAGRHAEAARKFQSALARLKNHPELELGRGLALLRAGDTKGAFEALQPVVTSNNGPLASSALALQGRIRFEEGDLSAAESLLMKARKRDEGNQLATRLLGLLYAKQKRFGLAIPLLKQTTSRNPLDFDATHLLGVSYLGTQQWRSAKPHLLKAHQMEPEDLAVLCNLASALLG